MIEIAVPVSLSSSNVIYSSSPIEPRCDLESLSSLNVWLAVAVKMRDVGRHGRLVKFSWEFHEYLPQNSRAARSGIVYSVVVAACHRYV